VNLPQADRHNHSSVDPDRKRKIRLVVAMATAVILAAGLVYVSFSASSEAKTPSDLDQVTSGGPYQLAGKVERILDGNANGYGPVSFAVVDDEGSDSSRLQVDYVGERADAFREGREIVVEGSMRNGVFVGDKDTLLTKCPSKFSEQAAGDTNVIIE
jgi:cytochrome c-type biogenesis protein CcmE